MELQIVDCEQNTPEWHAARMGIATASTFKTVMAKGKKPGEPSITRAKLLRQKAYEVFSGKPCEQAFSNAHTERGREFESEARDLYAMVRDVEPIRVGFIRRGDVGASPDSFIGEDGALEIKTRLPELQIELLQDDAVPPEHRHQLQGVLWISGRRWIDFVSYCPGLPLFIKRVERDERQIAEIKIAVEDFNAELALLVQSLNKYKVAA